MVRNYYRPPDQWEPVDEAFFLQLQEASHSEALILVGDFKHLDICWENDMVGCKQSWRFVESVEDNFPVQILDKPTRDEALLDLVCSNAEEIGGSLGCSNPTLVELVVLRNRGLAKSGIRTLNFRRANF